MKKLYVQFPTDNKYNQISEEMDRIPREFEVTVQFYVTAAIKVIAPTLEEAQTMVTRHGAGKWPPKKDWDDTSGDSEICNEVDMDNEFNAEPTRMRIRKAM